MYFPAPLQVVVGNYGLSRDEERVQFGLWAMFASSLLMSVDLRNVRPESKALLQNRRVISINQDPLGIPGRRIMNVSDVRIRHVECCNDYGNRSISQVHE